MVQGSRYVVPVVEEPEMRRRQQWEIYEKFRRDDENLPEGPVYKKKGEEVRNADVLHASAKRKKGGEGRRDKMHWSVVRGFIYWTVILSGDD